MSKLGIFLKFIKLSLCIMKTYEALETVSLSILNLVTRWR